MPGYDYSVHLTICPQCARQPFNQCPDGARLLRDLAEDVRRAFATMNSGDLPLARLLAWRNTFWGQPLNGRADIELLEIIHGLIADRREP
jgi:hypothetical protein